MTSGAKTDPGRARAGVLGLPETVTAGLFDLDGVRDFLASRGITLPEGNPDDDPDSETVNGLGNRKNRSLLRRIHQEGVEVFEGSRRYLEAARDAGLRRVVVSSSANTVEILRVTGLAALVGAGSTASRSPPRG